MIHRNMEDKRMKATIENKSDVAIHGLKSGGKLAVDTDREGTPLDKKWRRRIADSKIDGAIVVIGKDKELTAAMKADKAAAAAAKKAAAAKAEKGEGK